MTEITVELIERVAENARLSLSNEEKVKFAQELKEIISTFSALDEVDTEGIDISLQPVEIRNRMRDDSEKECLSQDEALSNAEHKKDGYFKGPKAV